MLCYFSTNWSSYLKCVAPTQLFSSQENPGMLIGMLCYEPVSTTHKANICFVQLEEVLIDPHAHLKENRMQIRKKSHHLFTKCNIQLEESYKLHWCRCFCHDPLKRNITCTTKLSQCRLFHFSYILERGFNRLLQNGADM